jgi:hypothetical protein
MNALQIAAAKARRHAHIATCLDILDAWVTEPGREFDIAHRTCQVTLTSRHQRCIIRGSSIEGALADAAQAVLVAPELAL